MKAVGYFEPLPINHPDSLRDLELPPPEPGPRDLLVRVHAISVNPVDTKIRANAKPEAGTPRVLGWDAVGTVEATGSEVLHYRSGDRVFYAGALARPGTNAELHAVDERIVGFAPRTLSDSQAAALPLTGITAWELLFDRLHVAEGGGEGETLLVVGGAGGVGSILIQLARQLTKLRVVATASRPETRQWCMDFGAHAVIDHRQPLTAGLSAIGIDQVDHVASLTMTDSHFAHIVECLKPQGQLALIDDPAALDVTALKRKSISLHWEFMFTRSMFTTPDMEWQRVLLNRIGVLADQGRVLSTANSDFGAINAANLRRAHALVESGRAQGKIVLQGF